MTYDIPIAEMPDPALRLMEIVERKGIGHPDTICDALAENFSAALRQFWLERVGAVPHYNVDKVLLRGGAAQARFGGGEVTAPIEIYFAGRATTRFKGVEAPLEALADEVARDFFRNNFHVLEPQRHVRTHCLIRPGSADLVELFHRPAGGVALANDSSVGVGFAPLSALERSVLDIDRMLRATKTRRERPAFGEDSKLLAARRGDVVELTVACAFCDRYVVDLDDYLAQKAALAALVGAAADAGAAVSVNGADDPAAGSIFLTVTGTSAEAGDDGEAGRGNRANGLIASCRPMSMEGVAGKNPISHVGKLYNIAADAIAALVVEEIPEIAAAECYLASRIGQPIDQPAFAQVRIAPRDGRAIDQFKPAIDRILRDHLLEACERATAWQVD